jgi:hypothetical protein
MLREPGKDIFKIFSFLPRQSVSDAGENQFWNGDHTPVTTMIRETANDRDER